MEKCKAWQNVGLAASKGEAVDEIEREKRGSGGFSHQSHQGPKQRFSWLERLGWLGEGSGGENDADRTANKVRGDPSRQQEITSHRCTFRAAVEPEKAEG